MTPEITGREAEIATIRAFLVAPEPGPHALVLVGPAGIGKSSVWVAGVALASDEGFRVLTSRPAEGERRLGHVVLADLFDGVETTVLDRLPPPRRRALEVALHRADADSPIDPLALDVGVASLLHELTRERRLVLAIDDDQWVDPSSRQALEFALRRSSTDQLRVLLARRVDGPEQPGLEGVLPAGAAERLAIGPLSVGAIQSILRERLDLSLPRPQLLRIHDIAEGNPFHALELARANVAAGRTRGSSAVIPAATRAALVDERLMALDPVSRQTLLLVAAAGRLAIIDLADLGILVTALEPAIASGVIEVVDDVVRFTHPLLASGVYGGATDRARRGAHARLAALAADPVDRARHLAAATAGPDGPVASLIEEAAVLALRRGMPLIAADLAERADQLTPPDHPDDRDRRIRLLIRGVSAAGDGKRARELGRGIVARTADGPRRGEALLALAEVEDPAAAMELLRQALESAAGVPPLESAIHMRLAEALKFSFTRSTSDLVEDHARSAVKLAEAARDDALHAYALAMLALVRFDRRDPDALAIAKEAYGRASRAADGGALMRAGSAVGHILTWMGDIPAARQWLGDQLEAWGHHDERGRSDALWYLSLVEFEAGRWTEAEAAAREAREISEQYGSVAGWIFLPGALIQLHRGELDAVRSEALALIENDEDRPLDHAFAIVATCDLWSGDVERSVPRFARAEQAADERGIGEPAMRRWRPDYAEALVRLGRLEEAVALIDAWDHDARPLRRHRVLADVTRSRGVIAAARGRHDEAELLLIEAAGAHLAAGDSFGRARALLTLGTVRRRRREKRAAREPIAQAIAEFQDLGARSWAAAAAAEMRRIGGRERVAGLTESERRVAALVAEGRTNREIGAALFLGERTVASHLSHIYGKLGIRSRTELAHRFSAGIDPAPPVGKVPSS